MIISIIIINRKYIFEFNLLLFNLKFEKKIILEMQLEITGNGAEHYTQSLHTAIVHN